MYKYPSSHIHIVTFEREDYRVVNESTIREYGDTMDRLSLNDPLEAFFLLEESLYNFSDIFPDIVTSTAIGGLVSSEMDGNATAKAALLRAIDKNFEDNKPIEPALLIMSYFQKPISKRKFFTNNNYRKTINAFSVAIEPQESI